MPEPKEVLEQILSEVRDIRTLIEGLMQPLVTIDPVDPHREPRAFRPFADKGVEVPDGMGGTTTLTAEQFNEQFGNGRT